MPVSEIEPIVSNLIAAENSHNSLMRKHAKICKNGRSKLIDFKIGMFTSTIITHWFVATLVPNNGVSLTRYDKAVATKPGKYVEEKERRCQIIRLERAYWQIDQTCWGSPVGTSRLP